ncbi:MAG: sigma-54 interaction domain-containing protein [Planctomycetota bacterium]|jgi:two-component system response regulator AtoC|nr:sigma-54 dependent transcriptional regulator [Blastopirellula sp.]
MTSSLPEFQPADFGLIGESPAMREVYRLTALAARSNASVLLLGETGTGKELIAGALHRLSARSTAPFVRVNCGALPETLLDSELFGHVKGSFTDAIRDRAGRFEAATGGTIFLDEINSTSSTLQVKLLRVLQERQFERVGESRSVEVDVRVIAASNRDLAKEVSEGRFREDLFWRLNVLPIQLPPLRRRREDIEPLIRHFLGIYGQLNERQIDDVEPAALAAMVEYNWPGNVRELQNYVERAVVLATGRVLERSLLPVCVTGGPQDVQSAVFRPTDDQSLLREFVFNQLSRAGKEASNLYDQIVLPLEKELLHQVMENCRQVQTKAAQCLGMNRNTLYKKLKEHGLDKAEE